MYTVRTIQADQEYRNAFTSVFSKKLKELEQQEEAELIAKFSKKTRLLMYHFSGLFFCLY
jgi:hypothetical protein